MTVVIRPDRSGGESVSVARAGRDGAEREHLARAGELALPLEELDEPVEVEEVPMAVPEHRLRAEGVRCRGAKLEDRASPAALRDERENVVAVDDRLGFVFLGHRGHRTSLEGPSA